MELVKYIFFDVGYTLVNEDNVWIERCKEQATTKQAISLGINANMLMDDVKTASASFKPQWEWVIKKYNFTQSAKYKSEFEVLYDDTRIVLETLSKKFRLGIIANQSGDLYSRLRNWKIDNYFSTIISSADYGFAKPDKRLFEVAIKKSGCAPHNVIMVGDRLDNDILPANQLGMKTIRIKQGFAKNQIVPSIEYQPTYELKNLSDILDLSFMK